MNDQDSSFDFGGLYTFTSVDNFVLEPGRHVRGAGARLDDGAAVAAGPDRPLRAGRLVGERATSR